MPHESIALERQATAEILAEIEGSELEAWLEEVPTGEVERTVAFQLAQRQGAGLFDAVVHILERQGCVSAPLPIAEFPEGFAKARLGRVPPAIFPYVRPGGVVVKWSRGSANLPSVFLEAEAPRCELGHDLEGRASTSRDDVHRSSQCVAPIEHRRPADHFDLLDVVKWYEVEVDFLDRRFIDPHTIEKHADALRDACHRGHLKAAD